MTITQDGFSIHTFEMNIQIKYDEYMSIKNTLYNIQHEFPGSIYNKTKNVLASNQFSYYGIYLNLIKSKFLPSYLKIEVNPATLLTGYNAYQIFQVSEDNIRAVKERINDILSILRTSFSFDNMSVSRIDLCVNIDMENSDIITSYIRLFKKSYIPKGFIRDKFDATFNNYKDKNKHSLHAHNSNIILNIYDKSYQIIDQNLAVSPDTIKESILRVEVGLLRPEIRNIKSTMIFNKSLNDNSVLLEFMSINSKALMYKYLQCFFSNDNYVTFSKAQKLIFNANFKPKIEKRLLHLLLNVSTCKNMNVAVENLNNSFNLSDTQIQYLFSIFHKLGINPITIKNSENHLSVLPGLLNIFKK